MVLRKLGWALLAMVLSAPVYAEGLTERAEAVGKTITTWTVVAVLMASLLGVGLMIAGGMQLKKYADNPQQHPLSKPLLYFVSGIIIFGISATSETMKETLFGESASDEGDFQYTRDF